MAKPAFGLRAECLFEEETFEKESVLKGLN
jgi:hypothetical protein